MATMIYDSELASLAELNVKKCDFEHDACHNTLKCKKSGQNLFYYKTTGELDVVALIDMAIKDWFSENENAKQSELDAYPENPSNGTIGHFTVMMRDSGISVGCAANTYSDSKWKYYLFTCNYCATNMIGDPVYVPATVAASCCESGKHPYYSALCSEYETY